MKKKHSVRWKEMIGIAEKMRTTTSSRATHPGGAPTPTTPASPARVLRQGDCTTLPATPPATPAAARRTPSRRRLLDPYNAEAALNQPWFTALCACCCLRMRMRHRRPHRNAESPILEATDPLPGSYLSAGCSSCLSRMGHTGKRNSPKLGLPHHRRQQRLYQL
ncbi:hypothetical protein V5799_026335 [Amblyomma americanum]|uniref:Uncharacterized protein n=1 Tax=Amblyomma americanum TaxID=6943 RepID=A0AAQ4DIV7_AMBAM